MEDFSNDYDIVLNTLTDSAGGSSGEGNQHLRADDSAQGGSRIDVKNISSTHIVVTQRNVNNGL